VYGYVGACIEDRSFHRGLLISPAAIYVVYLSRTVLYRTHPPKCIYRGCDLYRTHPPHPFVRLSGYASRTDLSHRRAAPAHFFAFAHILNFPLTPIRNFHHLLFNKNCMFSENAVFIERKRMEIVYVCEREIALVCKGRHLQHYSLHWGWGGGSCKMLQNVEDVTTQDVTTQDVTTQDVTTQDVTTQDFTTQDVTTQQVTAQDASTQDRSTQDRGTHD